MITDEQTKELPQAIGVYLFKSGSKFLYIGKSLNIRERVRNHIERAYFDSKEKIIIEKSDYLKFVICSSELHALVLESQLIQKYHPTYNIIWKDDKSYLYIKIPIKDEFPRVSLVRKENDGKSFYFGPYSSTRDVRFLLRAIRKVVPFCSQKQSIKKPCFYSKIGLCSPCPGSINKEKNKSENSEIKKIYRAHIRKVMTILEGKVEIVLEEIKNQIKNYSKVEEYEKSMELRDKLLHLEQLIKLRSFERFEYSQAYDPEIALEKLKTILLSLQASHITAKQSHSTEIATSPIASRNNMKLSRIECYDISNLMQNEATASMVVATNGILDKAEYKRFKLKKTGVSDFKMLSETITRRMNNEWTKPDLIVVDGGTPQVITISKVLRSLDVDIPLIGIAKHPDRLIVYLRGKSITSKFSLHNEGFRLIQQLRDESHRFAKKYHKLLRGKKYFERSI